MSPLEVEVGPMFSGKSSAIISEIKNHLIAEDQPGIDFLVFNHSFDNRYGESIIASHDGHDAPAIPIQNSRQLLDYITTASEEGRIIKPEYHQLLSVFIDEGQFFDLDLPEVLEYLDDLFLESNGYGLNIHVAGLDTDFARRPFGPMPSLMSKAVEVHKHTAVCTSKNGNGKNCKQPATYTQRLINGNPPSYNDPVVIVGAKEAYTARCRHHHVVYNKPQPK